MEPIKSGPGRRTVLTRSTIRPCRSSSFVTSPSISDSGEIGHDDQTNNESDIGDFGIHDPVIQEDISFHSESITSGKKEDSMLQNIIDDDKSQSSTYKTLQEIDGTDDNEDVGELDDAHEEQDKTMIQF